MSTNRPSSETMAVAALTIVSLVGGLAVACTAGAGAGPPPVRAKALPAVPAVPRVEEPAPSPSPSPPTAVDSPHLAFPPGAVVDVKATYHAHGDGVTDDTAALQAAISDNPGRPLYLPAGTYLVRRTLEGKDKAGRWQAGLRLFGENRNATVIKLADGSPGFGDRQSPRPVLRTGSPDDRPDPASGRSGRGDGNDLDNLTLDAGRNAGAVGIDYAGGGTAAIRRLTIVGNGTTGLAITRPWPGPALVSQVQVRGFDYGIRVAQYQYGVTLEHVALAGQRVAGLDNIGNILAVRDLTSVNKVPAVRSGDRFGLVSLMDATLTGGAPGVSAIDTAGELLARRVVTTGYRSAVAQGGKPVPGSGLTEYVSHPKYALFPTEPLDLPVRDAPEYLPATADEWAGAAEYGAKPGDDTDDTTAIQAALDSGKPAVYLPAGRYVVSGTLRLRGNLRAFVGFGATLVPTGTAFGDAHHPTPLISVEDGAAPDVTVRGLAVARPAKGATPGLVGFAQRTGRPLVLRDLTCCGDYLSAYHADPGAGPLFIENVSAARWQFDQPQQVWARQFAPQDRTLRVVNSAATLWILGFETEQGGPVLLTKGGGRTELLGGTVIDSGAATDVPFECVDGRMSLSFATVGINLAGYRSLVRHRLGPTSRDLTRQQAVWRDDGRVVPLYAG